jgi:hypothetical protein
MNEPRTKQAVFKFDIRFMRGRLLVFILHSAFIILHFSR